MKVCPFIVSYIYAILQQIYVQFRLDLEINVLLLKTLSFDTLQMLLFLMFFLSFFWIWASLFMDVVILVFFCKLCMCVYLNMCLCVSALNEGTMGDVYNTSPQSFIIMFSYSLAYQLWELLINFYLMVECPSVLTTNCNLQKG